MPNTARAFLRNCRKPFVCAGAIARQNGRGIDALVKQAAKETAAIASVSAVMVLMVYCFFNGGAA